MHALKRSRVLPTLVLLLMFGSGCWATTRSVTIRNETNAEIKITDGSDTHRGAVSLPPGERLWLSRDRDFWAHIRAEDGSVLGRWHVKHERDRTTRQDLRVVTRDGNVFVEEAPRSLTSPEQTAPIPAAKPE